MRIHFRYIKYQLLSIACIVILTSCGVSKSIKDIPDVSQYKLEELSREKHNDSLFQAGNNILSKNKYGQWELFIEGNAYQLGLNTGLLTQELFEKQERVFLNKVSEMVPSESKQKLLRKLLAWYNRKMYLHVPEEYKAEIYGLSKYAGDQYDYIAEDYLRVLYLHGAHDIGHAFQDLALVGCTSFAAWGNKTEDGKLLIGRNLDFYAGDAFAKDKIIAFVSPENGHNFMSVTWGGMIGVVSGMNDKGLTVTINAGKSKIPFVAKTPISILTREILQYASNIDEAIAIAKKREVFVSESIMVGSAIDKKAILIEVAPKNFGVYEIQNSNQLVCSNHFQSDAFTDDKRNEKAIIESHSQYRFDRMTELLAEEDKLNPNEAVAILRNRYGKDDKDIGYGNEKALNQLLAHHGIVFQPEDLKVWISSNPYQLGEFVAYDLNDVFKNKTNDSTQISFSDEKLTIAEDPFVNTEAFNNYETYRKLERKVEHAISNEIPLADTEVLQLTALNPNYFKAYKLQGDYYYQNKAYQKALEAFEIATQKEITTVPASEHISKYLKKSKRKAKRKSTP